MVHRVLITQNSIAHLGGSEIVSIELMEYMLDLGIQVTLYCPYVNQQITPRIKRLIDRGMRFLDGVDELDEKDDFDLIWVHHQLFPPQFIKTLSKSKAIIVFNHMSAYLPLEFPYLNDIESAVADLCLYNSPETEEAILTSKPELRVKSKLFPNPAPTAYSTYTREDTSSELRRILVVSNHPPKEVHELIERMAQDDIVCDIAGGSSQTDITPEVLSKYQAVITIGKTVQYCLVMGLPVYCYDHFGGPGYLSKENINEAAWFNFSGRGFAKKQVNEIRKELISGYLKAREFTKDYQSTAVSKYSLVNHLDAILRMKPERSHLRTNLDKSRLSSWEASQRLMHHFLKHQFSYEKKVSDLELLNNNLLGELEATEVHAQNYHRLEKMRSFRLARAIRHLIRRH